MKYLAWLALIALIIFALRAKKRSASGKANPMAGAETMVACAHCGVYIPASHSLRQSDFLFCSDAHRRLHFSK